MNVQDLSPFHASAASAIRCLKNDFENMPPAKRRKTDSVQKLQAAALALRDLANARRALQPIDENKAEVKKDKEGKDHLIKQSEKETIKDSSDNKTEQPIKPHQCQQIDPTKDERQQLSQGKLNPPAQQRPQQPQQFYPPYPHSHFMHPPPPPPPRRLPFQQPNPMGWMWPSLPAGAPMMTWYQQQHQPVKRHQAPPRPKRSEDEWSEADEQRLARLEANYKMSRMNNRKLNASCSTSEDADKTAPADVEPSSTTTAECLSAAERRKRTTWNPEEDLRLKSMVSALIESDDTKPNWTDVARLMPGRDSKQCRDRWMNHLDPSVKKHANAPWSDDEDRKLINFIKKHGTRWRLMQMTILPNRSELCIKNRWNSSFKRRYTRFLSDKWSIHPSRINLLNSQGLLHPSVCVEQILLVAKGSINQMSTKAAMPTSKMEGIVQDMSDKEKRDDVLKDVLKGLKPEESGDQQNAFIRIFKSSMAASDEAEAKKDLGVVEIPMGCCFAGVRNFLRENLSLDEKRWKFSIPELGILTSKQEVDLGPVIPILKRLGMGRGEKDRPTELTVVEYDG